MRLPRVRFSVRRMMVAVAIVAVVNWGVILVRRQGVYRVRAAFYARAEQAATGQWREYTHSASRRAGRSGERTQARIDLERIVTISTVDYWRYCADHHALMRAKYERLARYPWLPIDRDPLSPDGLTSP